jgi:hypothetical protein
LPSVKNFGGCLLPLHFPSKHGTRSKRFANRNQPE